MRRVVQSPMFAGQPYLLQPQSELHAQVLSLPQGGHPGGAPPPLLAQERQVVAPARLEVRGVHPEAPAAGAGRGRGRCYQQMTAMNRPLPTAATVRLPQEGNATQRNRCSRRVRATPQGALTS